MLTLAASLLLAAQSPTDGCPGIFVFFESGSAHLGREAKAALDGSWNGLREMIEAGAWLNLHGHADDVGPAAANLAVSRRRAEAVRDYYLARGVGADRLRIEAYGESIPLAFHGGREPNALVDAENRNVNIAPEMPRAVFERFFPPGGPIC